MPPRNTHEPPATSRCVTLRRRLRARREVRRQAHDFITSLSLPHMSTRINHVAVRFSAEELTQVRARARASHAPLATYLRQTSLGHVPRTKQLTEYADLVRALNQVGIALDAREGGDVGRALAELRDVLRAVSDRLGHGHPSRRAVAAAALE